MPQVSADAHVPVPPGVAAQIAHGLGDGGVRGGVGIRPLVHVRPSVPRWRFDAEGAGTRVVLVLPYAVQPAWVHRLTHEITSWALRRRARRRVEEVAAMISTAWQDSAHPCRGRDSGPSA